MNKFTKAILAIMLIVAAIIVAGCNKPDEPNNGGNGVPEAPIIGLFSINDSTQVCFSPGNLQYQASTDTWRFAENQWEYIGEDNANISETYDGWIDLFGWGTGDKPTYTSTYAYDTAYHNFVDWGTNSISNGMEYQWYALNDMDWHYLLAFRDTKSGIRYAAATVNGIKGLILLPDNWDASIYTFVGYNYNESTFDTHVITASQWKTLEMYGAIFFTCRRHEICNHGRKGSGCWHVLDGRTVWTSDLEICLLCAVLWGHSDDSKLLPPWLRTVGAPSA